MKHELDVILDDIIKEHEMHRKDLSSGSSEDLVDVLLRVKESGDFEVPIGYDNIKAVIFASNFFFDILSL